MRNKYLYGFLICICYLVSIPLNFVWSWPDDYDILIKDLREVFNVRTYR